MRTRLQAVILSLALVPCACSHDVAVASLAPDAGVQLDTVASSDGFALGDAPAADAAADVTGIHLPPGMRNSPCHLDGDLPSASGVELVPVFAKAGLQQPILLGPWGDGSDRLFVVQRAGKLVRIDNTPEAVQTPLVVLDLSARVNTAGEGGLLAAAIHPKFKQNRRVYVSLTTGAPMHSQVLEYTLGADDVALPASERLVIDVPQPPYTNHKGGMIAFDASGKLLFGLGDGGSANDPLGNGQNPQTLLAKMLRLDVDTPAGGLGYGIPKDNPFLSDPAFRPEIFAWGLRNPWRFSVDRVTGEIWAGDVGQDTWEEVDRIQAGHNYGWRTMEATHCFPASVQTCAEDGLSLPVAEYKHPQGKSITGGYVYRGSKQKSLYGKYIFADYDQGRVYTLPESGLQPVELAHATFQPVSFGEDRDGELYVLQLFGPLGQVFRVQEAPPQPAAQPLPALLSQTACFADLAALAPAPGVLPYEVNAPLWSDGAHKARFLVLPPGDAPITVPTDPYASWDLPAGTLLIKHFALGDTRVPVETRFMRRDADGWKFFTYRWRADGSDADLLPGGGGEAVFPATVQGQSVQQTWRYPQMADCASCHHAAGSFAAQVLGVQTAQWDRAGAWDGQGVPNQLLALRAAGVLPADAQTGFALPDTADLQVTPADSARAARAWLHSNCSHCHRPGGAAPSDMDLRFATPLAATHACKAPAQNGAIGATQILVPGQPDASVLVHRLAATPASGVQMPPVGVQFAQPGVVAHISAWISGLTTCAP